MKKLLYTLILSALGVMPYGLKAQTPNQALPDSTLEAMMLYEGFSNNLDSLLNLWYIQQALDTNNFVDGVDIDSVGIHSNIPDSVYINRLAQINSIIDLPFNSIVRSYINVYTQKKRDRVEVMLGLTDYYFPIFEEILDLYQLPTELRMLPVIESALNPRAVSRVGATGLWQFMYGTGRMYKLTINSYVDERRDPIASSHAAARFLKDLYSIYKDWTLVIAAYNCGPGNVNKAIRRSGGKRNYWDIYYYLPRETRGYVPAFIAATYALTYHKEHNLNPIAMNLPLVSDTIMVNDMLHLNQVAEVLNMPISTLRDLNPQYKMDIIPAKGKSYVLRIPMESVGQYIDNEQKIFAYKDSVYFNPNNRIDPAKFKSSYQYDVPSGSKKLVYRVKEGDVLGTIARRHGVSVSQLRSWNNIRGNIIRVGQKLTIYVKG
ncbi:MAG TPA: transglycosylase SLT domain-containing protein [Tenuifilaceae bacterium]|jgi:membrane-bound lytic murein transglycosylase D|nr:transglycosylase SLT domain-containing protein [Tenuifilaceae bacterium]HQB77720.1 transglycosylase SLT domain-containing protein [Tenuifilaceae bacterium]